MAKLAWLLATVLSAAYVSDAYKILVIFPIPGKSHNILGNGVVRHLLNAGHEVSYITPIISKKPHANLTQIDVSDNWEMMSDFEDMLNFETVMSSSSKGSDHTMFAFIFHMMSKKTLENPNVQKLFADQSQHFDVVIGEWMFSELYSGVASIYSAPLVWFSTVEPHGQVLALIDEYISTAYNGYYIDSLPPFSFADRVSELWQTVKNTVLKETIIRGLQWWDYGRLLAPHIKARGKVVPSIEELKYNASLMLGNSHVSLGQATRLPQAYKPVAGYHILETFDPLPEDLKKLMDEAKHGVIYFSMGSNQKSKTFPNQLKREILDVFGSLKQTVLWKFEEDLPDKPKNVHILQWAPQQSILAHPNCVLFITHGGLLSTTETVHAGVPIIGIPVFGDQFANVNRAVAKGFARKVPLSYNMAKEMKENIDEILSNPKYTQKVKELSFIYHDRPVKPGKELVHWVEHVINTKGAPHLRSPALLLPWYQKAYLDLVLLLAVLIYGIRRILKIVLPIAFPKRFGSKVKQN